MKTYRGSPAAARNYVEAGRPRADDYYLAEGTGVAERYVASPAGGVRRLAPLSGDGYEAWVAGVDPATGVAKGRLRNDENAVRFVEVTVNGPKSWSLAAELHPDISAAYDAAQDRAAEQIIAWLGQHATSRVGPRGGQVQVPVAEIEAVTVRHHTSRAGDPHRHLHLQLNARVLVEEDWRGLHTVGVRDSLDAINGIGHAAVMTDPQFREALAGRGFTVDEDGEIRQLRDFVGPLSARAGQIGRNIDRYETEWRAANPGAEPDHAQRRRWDARAWADGRPDKIEPRDGAELTRRWVTELHALGYHDEPRAMLVDASPVGALDRDRAVAEVLARLGARRSGWNAADIRGEVEQLIARRNVVVDAPVRSELAEDLTARTVAECVPLLQRSGMPEHVRALTSAHVLEVEADLTARLASRANTLNASSESSLDDQVEVDVARDARLDSGQREVVRALTRAAELIVVEGAAGAGKTTTLAATRTALEQSGHRLRVVTPTLKAARVAAEQVGADASSAAWLVYQHGFRWDGNGVWTRLTVGDADPDTGPEYTGPKPSAMLQRGDLLLCDEAGMLDQDTARALLTVADEQHARLAMVGDRHQLPAVGRGGVLDLAARWAQPDMQLTLDTVHRFTRTSTTADGAEQTVTDDQYAKLSLAMRDGDDPAAVFDALLERGQIRIHDTDSGRLAALASSAADAHTVGALVLVIADTNEQVAALNHAIRDQLVATGQVDDAHTSAGAGCRIGVGDWVVTRHNDTEFGVANRDLWTVTDVQRDGAVRVSGPHGTRLLPTGYVAKHVELGYASTVHGVQGDTAADADLLMGEHTSAGSAYVGMTRGRQRNTAHLVAESIDEAREQWVAAFGRDRADLGPAHAARLAEQEAARYAAHRPLADALADLRTAWTREQDSLDRLTRLEQRRDQLVDIVALTRERDATVPAFKQDYHQARIAAEHAHSRLQQLEAKVSTHSEDLATVLMREWDEQREPARRAAATVRAGTGLFGRGRSAVADATDQLQHWSARWQPYLSDEPDTTRGMDEVVGFAGRYDNTADVHARLIGRARLIAEQAHPEHAAALTDAQASTRRSDQARRAWRDVRTGLDDQLARYGTLARHVDLARLLTDTEQAVVTGRAEHDAAHEHVVTIRRNPALRTLPPERMAAEHERWAADREDALEQRYARSAQRAAEENHGVAHRHEHDYHYEAAPDRGPSIGR